MSATQLDLHGGPTDLKREIAQLRTEVDAIKRIQDGKAYHGDPWWIARRTEVLRLIDAKIVVAFEDVRSDLWFQADGCFSTPVQWDRGMARFARNTPRAEGDDSVLFQFLVSGKGRGRWFLARLNEAHCAIETGVGRMHMRDARIAAQAVRRLREQYGAADETECERCKRDLEKLAR